MADLPASLLAKLTHEQTRFQENLASDAPLPALQEDGKAYASRRFLALTPLALDAVEDILTDGDPREQLKAAELVFDRSSATQILQATRETPTLPLEAFALLVEGMSRMFTGAAPIRAASLKEAVVLTDPIFDPTFPKPSTSEQFTALGMVALKADEDASADNPAEEDSDE